MGSSIVIPRATSLGTTLGKTSIYKTGTLTTTAVTADQVVLTYTVTTNKTFYCEYLDIGARLTTAGAAATILGTASLETPSGTKDITWDFMNPTTSQYDWKQHDFGEPLAVASGVVIRVVCTPAAATSFKWQANFGGYEIG